MICTPSSLHVRRRASGVTHPALWLLLALLLMSVKGAVAQAATAESTIAPEYIVPTYNADPNTYYNTLASQDSTIFAGTSTSTSSDSANYPNLNMVRGLRTIFNIPNASSLIPTTNLPNSATAAVRADVLSELFVTMAVLFLEASGALPFARTAPIPSTYLPSTYVAGNTFVSPNFPTIPITLNMMLQHISSITETGFDIGAATTPAETVPTLSDFVAALFDTESVSIFGANQPGLSSSYTYSRTNTALVSYIVERILATSSQYATLNGIGDFVFTVILPPLQLSSTFLMNRNGTVIATTYPASSSSTQNMLYYLARQDINNAGTGVLTAFPIHASYFSDYMLFTSGADLAKIALQVFVPGGIYYNGIGAQMVLNSSPVSVTTMLYTTARTPGLFLFDANQLCSIMYAAISYSGTAPYCYYSSATVAATAPAFGLVTTSGVNEIAVVCVPVASSGKTFCTVADISFRDAGWRAGDEATAGNRAVGLAMVSLAYLTSEPVPTTTTTTAAPAATSMNAWFVVIGVVATLVVVVVAAYVTDYIIQPPPPAKIIAPVVTGQIGLRNGAATVADLSGTGRGPEAVADGEDALDDGRGAADDEDSPKAFRDPTSTSATTSHGRGPLSRRRRSGSDGFDGDESDSDDGEADATVTPYVLRSGAGAGVGGGSSLRRRNPGASQRGYASGGGHRAGPYAARDDGWGDELDEEEDRSSTGSQRPNPNGRLRFDAYI